MSARRQQALRARPDQIERWHAAAAAAGISVNQWITDTLERACETDPAPRKPAAAAKPRARNNTPPAKAACPRLAQHRAGVFCKTCGRTP